MDQVNAAPAVLSPELEEAIRLLDPICEETIARNADRVDQEHLWPAEGMARLQAAGLCGLVAPDRVGGMGLGLYALAQVCARIGRDCSSTALCFGMHCVGTAVIAAKSTAELDEKFLRPIAEGRHLTTLSLSETGTGAQFYTPETCIARLPEGGYRIDGEKSFVTNGGHADSYVASVVHTDEPSDIGHFSCAVIPADTPGLSWGGPWEGLGMCGNSSRTMRLKNAELAPSLILGKEGDQIWYVFRVVAPYFLVAMAGTYLGIAASALEEARRHLSDRWVAQTGRGLAQLSVIQTQFGTLWRRVERARALVNHAAMAGDAGHEDADSLLMAAKIEASEAAVEVVNEAMSLVGGKGYRKNSVLHRLMRDARASHVMSPTTNLLQLWIGRMQLGEPVLGD